MKTQEDEAWEEMERRQGAGGFKAKRAMAANKQHWSDCAVHNGPAYPAGECDCGAAQKTEREALKLALEVMQINLTLLEKIDPYKGQEDLLSDSLELTHEAIASIEAALAQPAQEPVACIRSLTDQCAALIWERDELQKQVWRYEKNGVTCQIYGHKVDSSCSECNVHENYTAAPKREWVGLTDEEMDAALRKAGILATFEALHCIGKEVEAKLREKNNG